ncbi:MAG: glutamine--fructose-6-phosphate transaminase (isomerizing) [Fusobacteria bacterium]|nr:glutamine--fructose-6-phosphate transaminase (isomerizing) [Fusobacteriota bacterium]
MCGIVGYIGEKDAKNILYNGLTKLEYKGYDSSGIALIDDNKNLIIKKESGKLTQIKKYIEDTNIISNIGIGHTRWATHGKPTQINSHPHTNCRKTIALVHNGIIENYLELKEELIKKDHKIISETDSEIIVHLISEYYTGNLYGAVQKIIQYLKGTFAIAVISESEPDKIIIAKKGTSMLIGIGENENIFGSDIPPILEHTKNIIVMDDYEIGVIEKNKVTITDLEGNILNKVVENIDLTIEMAEKSGFKHFMLKEIHEQPRVVEDVLRGKIENGKIKFDNFNITKEELRKIEQINIIACGTSYHAGLVGKFIIEEILKLPVIVEIASEFRYKTPILSEKNLVIVISQSGETSDTLGALRVAKQSGAKVIGMVNVIGSTIAKEAYGTIYTNAGPEIGVASTKAFLSQLTMMYLFMLYLGDNLNLIDNKYKEYIIKNLEKIPEKISTILNKSDEILNIAKQLKNTKNIMYIARHINYPVALEGSLKLKETSYIHSEAYPAGELRHGPVALIEENVPALAIALKNSKTYDKMLSNIQEIKARDGKIIVLASEDDENIDSIANMSLKIEPIDEIFSPLLTVIPLQILAYYISDEKGLDVDNPRNLSKSVTVE